MRLLVTLGVFAWWATAASAQTVTVVHDVNPRQKWNEIHPVSRIQVE
jgi:hypothetical protein